jgi:hypothetical protein
MRIHFGLVVFGMICHIVPVSAQETNPTNYPTNSEVLLKTTDDRANDTSVQPILQEPATTPQAPSALQSWLEDTIGPRSLVVTAIPAVVKTSAPPDRYPPEWCQGVQGASRNSGDALASSVSVQTTRRSLAAVLHQDLRYN